jgi:hypothetical protein
MKLCDECGEASDASKANWHMDAVLYGLIKQLLDDVLGRPAENEQHDVLALRHPLQWGHSRQ